VYTGRFAPSPTGPLHAGSLVAALASWLDARAHGGRWLVRIEDLDTPRCVPGADERILMQLAALGLTPDAPPQWQSRRTAGYATALEALRAAGRAYPCGCSRKEIEGALGAAGVQRTRHEARVYPGTCRAGLAGRPARALRLLTTAADGGDEVVTWHDRRLGVQRQNVTRAVGDFVLRRADGLWAYQLAGVVDDAAQGITDVVRGEDLADNTPRQILLQRSLGLVTPRSSSSVPRSPPNAADGRRPPCGGARAGSSKGDRPASCNFIWYMKPSASSASGLVARLEKSIAERGTTRFASGKRSDPPAPAREVELPPRRAVLNERRCRKRFSWAVTVRAFPRRWPRSSVRKVFRSRSWRGTRSDSTPA